MHKKRILLIDDEPDVLVYLAFALKDNGYEPVVAESAADGLDLVRTEKPDLICLDILMPGQSGLSLYQTLQEEPELNNVPVVIVTGLNVILEEDGSLCLEGIPGIRIPRPDGVIEKPVNLARFMDMVKELAGPADGESHAHR